MAEPSDLFRRPSSHRYSFSGADARVFTYFSAAPDLVRPLSTVHTISISVHEAKGQARALGHRGIKGLARGVRTIAGSLILTVINDHPLRELFDQHEIWMRRMGRVPGAGWSVDRDLVGVGHMLNSYDLTNRLPTLLPPFELAMQYVSEVSPAKRPLGDNVEDPFLKDLVKIMGPEGAGLLLSGVEFIDDGIVTSTNDIVSEKTFSFIAHDYKPLTRFSLGQLGSSIQANPSAVHRDHDAIAQALYGPAQPWPPTPEGRVLYGAGAQAADDELELSIEEVRFDEEE